MSDATVYKCPQCFAPLRLDPKSGQLVCEYCNGLFDPDVIETLVDRTNVLREEAHTKAATEAKQRDNLKNNGTGTTSSLVDLETISIDDWDRNIAAHDYEQFDEMVGYTCTNCAAQVVADKLTVATSCQYCGSSVVVDQRLSGGLKPGYVIPFKVSASEIPERLTSFYKDRPLLPKNFFKDNCVGEVQGLYVPFWLYDGVVHGNAKYHASTSHEYREGGDDVTETKYYDCTRVGNVAFNDVPVDASERIDDDLMDSIEPFHYNNMRPFKAAYLTGFVAERFDKSPKEVFDRASSRMKTTAEQLFSASVVGSSPPNMEYGSFEFTHAAASYVLLPVYLFNCRYMGKTYRYAVNGQTGKIVGEVPIGKKESTLVFLKSFFLFGGISAVILWAIGILMQP